MESKSFDDIEQKYQKLLQLEPKLISSTIPENGSRQKELFIAGDVYVPDHTYPKLDVPDTVIDDIQALGDSMLRTPSMDSKHAPVYSDFVERYKDKTRLLQAMHSYNMAETTEAKEAAAKEYMELNIELYGVPDRETYVSLLSEKLAKLSTKDLPDTAKPLLDELSDIVPVEYRQSKEAQRFMPSSETIAWMHGAVETLYGPMLSHVPSSQETFNVSEAREVFEDILSHEFGEAASGWRVDIETAKSINVKTAEKRIVIPEDRNDLTRDELRRLIVHEIGVHVLRSITGEQTDIGPLRSGLSEYYDAEEGLGKVMEQALMGEYVEAGVDHYITAGAAYFDNMDFREIYEMKWRIQALEKLEDGDELSDAAISKAKSSAYGSVMRIFRGTDELPWFKDLAYYNGTASTWKHLETIKGDDAQLTLLMMGKVNTTKEHLGVVLESRSV